MLGLEKGNRQNRSPVGRPAAVGGHPLLMPCVSYPISRGVWLDWQVDLLSICRKRLTLLG